MVPGRLRPQETGEALLDRLRGGKADGSAPSAPAVRELRPAEAAKDEGNKAFARGDWLAAAAQYSRWVGGAGSGGAVRAVARCRRRLGPSWRLTNACRRQSRWQLLALAGPLHRAAACLPDCWRERSKCWRPPATLLAAIMLLQGPRAGPGVKIAGRLPIQIEVARRRGVPRPPPAERWNWTPA